MFRRWFCLATLLLLGLFQLQGQSQWHVKPMLGLGADAEMFFGGPVIQLGSGVYFGKKFSVDGEYSGHFAGKRAPAFDPSLTARWRQHTMAILATFYFGQYKHQGFYLGTGPAIQYRNYRRKDSFASDAQEFLIFTLSLRMGQAFRINSRQSFLLEANFIGPYYERELNGDSGIEIFTQLSFNAGFRFDLRRKHQKETSLPPPTL